MPRPRIEYRCPVLKRRSLGPINDSYCWEFARRDIRRKALRGAGTRFFEYTNVSVRSHKVYGTTVPILGTILEAPGNRINNTF